MIRHDLKSLNVSEMHWYGAALCRSSWRDTCNDGLMAEQQHQQHRRSMPPHGQVQCQECRRVFRREVGKARYKCTTERQKQISEQSRAVQCPVCHRWFHSKGGLTVHRCSPVTNPDPANIPENTTRSRARAVATRQDPLQLPRLVQCQQCERWFRRPSDRARHKCAAEIRKPVQDQHGSVQCTSCNRWFLS